MEVIVATEEPHLRGPVAREFEVAPYYLAVDTLAGRTTLFVHPAQFQVAVTPEELVHRLRAFAPEAVVAGSFSADLRVTDDDLRDVVAYLREMQKHFAETSTASTGSGMATQPTASAASGAGQPPTSQAVEEPPVFIVHRSYIPDAPPGPSGLAPAYLARLARPNWAIPDNARDYFGMFFVLTGFGSLHVLAALATVVTALVTVLRRRLPDPVPTPLVAATAAWWWATGCWGLVYGLLYV